MKELDVVEAVQAVDGWDEPRTAYIWVGDDPHAYTWAVRHARWHTDYEEAE